MKRLLLLSLVCLAGCESGLYNLVSEEAKDPQSAGLSSGMFDSMLGIPLAWAADPLADEYIVQRRLPTTTNKVDVYRGVGSAFVDQTANPDTMYVYTLTKTRGQAVFLPGPSSVGAWGSQYLRDPQGSNDIPDAATVFSTNQVNDHIFYYAVTDVTTAQRRVLADTDWYKVYLQPHWRLLFKISYGLQSNPNDPNSTTDPGTVAYLIVSTVSDTAATNGKDLSVANPTDQAGWFWFSVHVNPSLVTGDGSLRVDYSLQPTSMIPL